MFPLFQIGAGFFVSEVRGVTFCINPSRKSSKSSSMAEKMYIKQLYEDGVSKSEIQRRTKLNYRTVSKYAEALDIDGKPLPEPVQATGAVFSAKRAL